jgi:tRNA (guanine37-N1)-methyltransferase
MKIDIISVVPDLLDSPFAHSILKRAREKGLLEVNVINLRDHTTYARAQVDDYAFWRRCRHGDDDRTAGKCH